jgi:tRNA-modifying protein YgfZ
MLEAVAATHTTAGATIGEPVDAERQYRVLTESCALVDRSERGKLALTGLQAAEFLNGQVTNDVLALAPGEGCYAAFLTHKGKMLGDLRVLAVAEHTQAPAGELLLDTERGCLQALFDMITRFKVGYDVQLHKRTLQLSLLSLAGPGARELLMGIDGVRAIPAREHDHLAARIAGAPVRLIATALPSGVDVLMDASAHEAVLAALVRAGAQPVPEEVAEIVRVECGRPRYGVDLDDGVIPQEAGLNERAVSFTKGCYVGQETVARLHYRGKPNRHLRGLRLSKAVPDASELVLGDRAVGLLTSSVLSPVHGPIGLALLRREAEPGTSVEAGDRGASAAVIELPFSD